MRKPRILREGALYHVTARANRKEMILNQESVKALFLDTLTRAKAKYRFELVNFCIMGNHYHLMIRPSLGENLSAIMRWIMSVFAMAFNRMMGLTGHVWERRFFSRIIEGFQAFIEVFSYIDMNPVSAMLVEQPRDWEFGGLWHHRAGSLGVIDRPSALIRLAYPEHSVRALPRIVACGTTDRHERRRFQVPRSQSR